MSHGNDVAAWAAPAPASTPAASATADAAPSSVLRNRALPSLPISIVNPSMVGTDLRIGMGQVRVHRWFAAPLHVQISTAAPLPVAAPVTSRHSPDCTPTTVPSELTRHCWLVPPLHVQISTRVPAAVARPGTPRHFAPYTVSSLPDVSVHC